MLIVAVMTITLVMSIGFTQNSMRAGRKVSHATQAYNVARGGLVDTIAWFKRQKDQPVTAFTPVYRADNPLKGDTNDPYQIDPGGAGVGKDNLGIVQEFEIDHDQNLWARYEVGKITKLGRDAKGQLRDYTIRSNQKDPATNQWVWQQPDQAIADAYEGVQDLTEEYGLQGQGLLWRIRSHGYVYRKDPTASAATRFYQYPNEVLAQTELDTEIFRLQVRDYGAAIVGDDGANITLRSTGQIAGGDGFALIWNKNPCNPPAPDPLFTSNQPSAYHCLGVPPMPGASPEPPNSLDWYEVFGVSDGSVIANLADSKGTDHTSVNGAPMSLVYLKPPAGTPVYFRDARTGPTDHPLYGGGILVVDGDMVVNNWGTNTWNGVIYVTGNLTISCLSNFSGETIVRGKIDWRPTDIEYNPSILSTVRQRLCQYRERRAPIQVTSED